MVPIDKYGWVICTFELFMYYSLTLDRPIMEWMVHRIKKDLKKKIWGWFFYHSTASLITILLLFNEIARKKAIIPDMKKAINKQLKGNRA